jgi:HlyD family secretion protein
MTLMTFVSIALLISIGCHGSASDTTPTPDVSVEVTRAKLETISQTVSGGGTLYPLHQASLTPKISSPVKEFYVNRGDRVRAGQLLAVLEDRDLAGSAVAAEGSFDQAKATYAKTVGNDLPEETQAAKAAVENAQVAEADQQKLYDSYNSLYQQHAGARRQVEQTAVTLTDAKSQLRIAEKHLADLEASGRSEQVQAAKGQMESARGQMLSARAQLEYTHLRSPIAGVVADRSVYPGDIAPAGTPLITVMDVSSVIVRLHLSHSESSLLKLGDRAVLHVSGLDKEIQGKVSLISPALDPNSTTVEVWIEAANTDNTLQPGSSVQVGITAKTVPNALVIPQTAMLTDGTGAHSVMTVVADHKAHSQDIRTGIEDNGMVQVLSGLEPGEAIVATGAYGLPDGTTVKAVSAASPENTSGTQP